MKIWMVLVAMAIPLAVAFLFLDPDPENCMKIEDLLHAAPEDVVEPCDQNNLGDLYYYGDGVAEDHAQALLWFRLAAEKGHPDAQHNMGEMYFNGEVVPRDYVEAYMWLDLASADPGRVGKAAAEFRDRISSVMTPDEIEEAAARSTTWKPKAEP
jgi:hypothetical protein